MKLILIFLTLSFSTYTLGKNSTKKTSCDYTFTKYCVELKFTKKPSRSYDSEFKIYFKDIKTNKLVMPTEKVMSYLWMKMDNGHEHGSAPVKMTREKDHFLVKNVWFVMIGDWELFLMLKKDGKVLEKKVKKITINKN